MEITSNGSTNQIGAGDRIKVVLDPGHELILMPYKKDGGDRLAFFFRTHNGDRFTDEGNLEDELTPAQAFRQIGYRLSEVGSVSDEYEDELTG